MADNFIGHRDDLFNPVQLEMPGKAASSKYYAQFYCISISLKIMQVFSQVGSFSDWLIPSRYGYDT